MTPVLAVLPLLISAVISASIPQIRENKPSFPPTHGTTFHTHDPTVILSGDDYYSYSVGDHIRIYRSPSLSGPWEDVGSVLDSKSEIHKGNRQKPWAPSAIHHNGVYYCYYAVSEGGARNSAIGVATSLLPGPGLWKDHGLIVQSGKGNDANMTPFDISNTIDPDVSLEGGQPYLTFGSYWSGIWQVPLEWNMVSADYHNASQARHLAIDVKPSGLQHSTPAPLDSDPHGPHPIEGPFIGFHNGWYYLWFSSGQCCGFDPDSLPPPGDEYVLSSSQVLC